MVARRIDELCLESGLLTRSLCHPLRLREQTLEEIQQPGNPVVHYSGFRRDCSYSRVSKRERGLRRRDAQARGVRVQ
jgi:hypothetical protein